MEKAEPTVANPRRAVLRMAVADLLKEKGIATADKECVETLTEVYIHFFRFNLYFQSK